MTLFRAKTKIISAELLAVGSNSPHNVKTEIFSTEIGRWFTLSDYPFV